MNDVPAGVSRLEQRLEAGRFVITAEITPPVSCDPAELLAKAAPLRGLADAVNVTDGAGARAHLAVGAAAAILMRAGIEPVLQLTCRDRNRIALQSELLGAAANGIRNLLLLGGDKPSAGDQPDAKPVFDLDSLGLIEAARLMRDKGELPTGRKLGGTPHFFIGAADLPIDPPPDWQAEGLRRKIAAGAQFIQTQFCMDGAVARRYAARLAELGIVPDLKVVIGISPLRSARAARWMRHHLFGTIIPDATIARLEAATDEATEGKRICLDVIEDLRAVPGIAGVHVMAPGNESALAEVIGAARSRLPA
jgi:methylenetetrahydrofolate reductase (NADPH)